MKPFKNWESLLLKYWRRDFTQNSAETETDLIWEKMNSRRNSGKKWTLIDRHLLGKESFFRNMQYQY